MGTCQYCNQKAGLLRKQHPECRDLHATGVRETGAIKILQARADGRMSEVVPKTRQVAKRESSS